METIPEYPLKVEETASDAIEKPRFQWAEDEIGNRNKLGGKPTFLQEVRYPKCPDCKEPMIFYGQLDSISGRFCIADCGMIYVFICFDCLETKSILQSN